MRAALVLAFAGLAGALLTAPAQAAFPGSNGPIVFQSNRDTAAGELYARPLSGPPTRLTFSGGSSDPVVSPDGAKIAFISSDPGGDYQVYVINADGSGRTQLTTSSTAKQEPAWSADGTRIAYVANSFDVDGQTDLEIWSISAAGGAPTQLTSNTFPDTQPAWSPLGGRIAFVSNRPGDTDRNVYVMNADGSGQTNITPNSPPGCAPNCYGGHDDNPAWSPDGAKIAYVHNNTPSGGGLSDIWTMDPNGANRTNLSNNDGVAYTEPAWAPQGDRLVMVGAVTTNRDIWVMNADGSGQAPLESHPAAEISPDWGAPAPPDTTPPALDLTANKKQRLGKAVKAKAGCDEACTVTATGKLTVKGGKDRLAPRLALGALRAGKLKLKPDTAQIAAGERATLKLKLKGKTRKLAKRALEQGAKVKAKLKTSAVDAAGNRTTAKAAVKLKR